MAETSDLPEYAAAFRLQADGAAARLVRRFRLPTADRDDFCHDILLDLFIRLRDFDPCRGTMMAFTVIVIRHAVARLAARLRRERTLFASVSLDDPINRSDGATLGDTFGEQDGYLALIGGATNPIAVLETQLSLIRALNTLPAGCLHTCSKLLNGSDTWPGVEPAPSRASQYRQLNDVRLRLLAAGLGPPA